VNEVTIRAVLKEGCPAWKPIWDSYNAFYGRVGETALPAEVAQMTCRVLFDADAGSPRVYWQTHKTNDVARRPYDKVAEVGVHRLSQIAVIAIRPRVHAAFRVSHPA